MEAPRLYKYLDTSGGLKMLEHHNLQFTNATKLNDPFDIHPDLLDYSEPDVFMWEEDDDSLSSVNLGESGRSNMNSLRKSTWICSLSKTYNSLLMWSYYNKHTGICIGLDMEKLRPNLPKLVYSPLLGALELEINYDEIIKKPNYFYDKKEYWGYLVSTKAKEWKHEQEVRLALLNPSADYIPQRNNNDVKNRKRSSLLKHLYYSVIEPNCFESVYLGVNILTRNKNKIIKVAKNLNPDIKIYQMTIDPKAFRLKEEQL